MDHEISPQSSAGDSPANDLLKRLRTRLSQAEISRRTGIHQSTLSRWESGGVADAADSALKLAKLEAELDEGTPTTTAPEKEGV